MKKRIRLLLLAAYCIPFAYLSVKGDGASGTMLFYGVMAAGFGLLCWGALKTGSIATVYMGNALSVASSYGVARLSGLPPMGHYFKPFTAYSLMAAISIAAVVLQTGVVWYYSAKKKPDGQ